MEITINNKTCEVPFDLMSISLSDFLKYYDEYGRDLDKAMVNLLEKKYEDEDPEINELQKIIDLETHIDTEALAWFSFWTKSDLFEVRDEPFIIPVLQNYRLLRHLLKNEENNINEYPLEVTWKSEDWSIQNFIINPASEMSFNEIITSKETMRQIHAVGKRRWDALPYLCAIFFRKKNEAFSDELIQQGGERMELLKTLPLRYAFQIAFFLSCCVNTWKKTLAYSAEMEAEIPNLN